MTRLELLDMLLLFEVNSTGEKSRSKASRLHAEAAPILSNKYCDNIVAVWHVNIATNWHVGMWQNCQRTNHLEDTIVYQSGMLIL